MKTKYWSVKVGNYIYQCEIHGNTAYFYGGIPYYTKEGDITREDVRKHISKYINEKD